MGPPSRVLLHQCMAGSFFLSVFLSFILFCLWRTGCFILMFAKTFNVFSKHTAAGLRPICQHIVFVLSLHDSLHGGKTIGPGPALRRFLKLLPCFVGKRTLFEDVCVSVFSAVFNFHTQLLASIVSRGWTESRMLYTRSSRILGLLRVIKAIWGLFCVQSQNDFEEFVLLRPPSLHVLQTIP